VQFSYIIYDSEKESIEKTYDEIISVPENVSIPLEASEIHCISTEMSRSSTITAIDCILPFIYECTKVDLVIGHNLLFDNGMVVCELERHKQVCEDEIEILNQIIQKFIKLPFYCTMQETTQFCNIVQPYKNSPKTYVKYPKLIELHDKLFGKDILKIQLHNSLNDVFVCFRCFYKFKYDIDIVSKLPFDI